MKHAQRNMKCSMLNEKSSIVHESATNIDPLRGKVMITFQQFPTTSDQ
jgi:hypothetical protein